MVSEFLFRITLFIFLSGISSQENIWQDAEEFIQVFFEFEEDADARYFHRIRMVPKENDETWQQKIMWDHEKYKLGFRMDKTFKSTAISNRKGYFLTRLNTHTLFLGNSRLQIGNSLLFGSPYNSIRSPEGLLSCAKIRWKISPYMNPETIKNPKLLILLKEGRDFRYHAGLDNQALSTSLFIKRKKFTLIYAGYFQKKAISPFQFPIAFHFNHSLFPGKNLFNPVDAPSIFNCLVMSLN